MDRIKTIKLEPSTVRSGKSTSVHFQFINSTETLVEMDVAPGFAISPTSFTAGPAPFDGGVLFHLTIRRTTATTATARIVFRMAGLTATKRVRVT